MYGNVSEWCLDWRGAYDTSVSPAVDPKGASSGDRRILRGGRFKNFSPLFRSGARDHTQPNWAEVGWGFRLCLPLQ
jgi:formylglycine-generating enzyme required for sulfatase activity